jgi:hypothetical protein
VGWVASRPLRSIDRGFFERGEISLNPWFMQQALFHA